ncbi:CapA family protein [Flavobacterium sp.]|uniref:CapA family protein n=1 Tax=Flavobacterium sp. TaxID=239 RepID=UPI0040487820
MINIGFTGDFCPWLRIEEEFNSGNISKVFETVTPFFMSNDLNVLDLECPMTISKSKIIKTGPHIKSDPNTVVILNHLNCKLVATANNHFKDYGWEGMKETYDSLRNHNINWVGSGENFEEASKVFYWEKNDIKFAFINIAENEWTTTTDENPGCNPLDLVNVFNAIQEAKNKVDFVIVIVHGGHEHYELPSPRMKKWYRFFVDSGASAVIGHHTHIISGFEIYKEAPIFYSLGNFCFDWEGLRNLPWNKGMIIRLGFEKGKTITLEREFISQLDNTPEVLLLKGEEKLQIEKSVSELNSIILDDVLLEKKFIKYTDSWKPMMNTWLQPYKGKYLPSLYKKGLLPNIISKNKKLLYTNLIRCESHRDILLNTINQEK